MMAALVSCGLPPPRHCNGGQRPQAYFAFMWVDNTVMMRLAVSVF